MVATKFILNFGLLLALLIAPSMALMAWWYRKQLARTLMIWRNPEMVIVTITFSVAGLILFIVGASCLFTYYDVLDPSRIRVLDKEKFKFIGIICALLLVALVQAYAAIRLLLVRVVTDRGIILNDRIFRVPDFRSVVEWGQISDYYVLSDYPNVIYTLIVQKEWMTMTRVSVRVPVYIRDEFEQLLESKMNSAAAMRTRTGIGSHKFSEN